jgi:hypothetical protein
LFPPENFTCCLRIKKNITSTSVEIYVIRLYIKQYSQENIDADDTGGNIFYLFSGAEIEGNLVANKKKPRNAGLL